MLRTIEDICEDKSESFQVRGVASGHGMLGNLL